MYVVFHDDFLEHYGTPRHSGRWPYGSGENPYQHPYKYSMDFLSQVDEIKKKNPKISDVDLAKELEISTTVLRDRRAFAQEELKMAIYSEVDRLHEKGMSNRAIGSRMGISESTVRSYLATYNKLKDQTLSNTAGMLKDAVRDHQFVEVGEGTARWLGMSDTKLRAAVQRLEDEGYVVHNFKVNQLGTGYNTTLKVLCPRGTDYVKDLVPNRDKIYFLTHLKTDDSGLTFKERPVLPARSVDPNRVKICYREDGGIERDGLMLLRPDVEDLNLGGPRYAQVRIKVGDELYLKGMAMYGEEKDFPDGVDIIFNTNKAKVDKEGNPVTMADVLKPLKDSVDYEFGATVIQKFYKDKDGNEQQSSINIVGSLATPNQEGNWGDWSKELSAQFLAKQPVPLAKQQLVKAVNQAKKEYDEICSLTNPVVKRHLLLKFADECDGDATHLSAAGLPRQQWHVLLPFPDIPDDQVYAPNFADGERVVLIRYPHAGRFELAELTVNNKLPTPKKLIPGAKDAVGINSAVAEKLSGADFDGDTVLVIPNNDGKIKVAKTLEELEGFDPKVEYKKTSAQLPTSKENGFSKPREMGTISNLITDMTIKNASLDEIARAVKHSMVVIDAEKHNLDYKRSYEENGIRELKIKYQGKAQGGAATLISRAGSPQYIPQRSLSVRINEEGEKEYKETGATYYKRGKDGAPGKLLPKQTKVSKMSLADDALLLASDPKNPTEMERVYGEYANAMKALATEARREYMGTPTIRRNPAAAEAYSQEVATLTAKLNNAKKNSPLEREAQLLGNISYANIRKENPDAEKDQLKKWKGQQLQSARARVGAKKESINITPKEWEAIQAGAVSSTLLEDILKNTKEDVVRSYAMPRSDRGLSPVDLARAKQMLGSGNYTQAEVARVLGVPVSTLLNNIDK